MRSSVGLALVGYDSLVRPWMLDWGASREEHNQHIMDAREIFVPEYADEHRICVFGEVAPQLMEFFNKYAGVVTVFTFLMGFELSPSV